jgi:hypothetical protein
MKGPKREKEEVLQEIQKEGQSLQKLPAFSLDVPVKVDFL